MIVLTCISFDGWNCISHVIVFDVASNYEAYV